VSNSKFCARSNTYPSWQTEQGSCQASITYIQARAHAHAHTRTHTRTHARTHAHTRTPVPGGPCSRDTLWLRAVATPASCERFMPSAGSSSLACAALRAAVATLPPAACICVCMCVCICVCMYIYVCVYVHAYVCTLLLVSHLPIFAAA